MKKLLTIVILLATSIAAQAEEKPLSLEEQIMLDAMRNPYAESPNPTTVHIEKTTIVEEYVEPEAAEHMKPSRVFKLDRKGNTIIQN